MKTPNDMLSGAEFKTNNYGTLTIISYNNKYDVDIIFKDTGWRTKSESSHIRSGTVKDKMRPNINGVGFIGDGPHGKPRKLKGRCAYTTWVNVIRRCYDAEFHKKQPTYAGCEVCEDWHNFQNFAEWYLEHYPTSDGDWQIDKDLKVKGNKVYAPEFCQFVTRHENIEDATAKNYSFKNPNGEVVNIYNLAKFAKSKNLHASHMCAVHNGKLKQHKGWTKA